MAYIGIDVGGTNLVAGLVDEQGAIRTKVGRPVDRTLGADAVGMSTACEAVAANHMGMRICGISCISNLACGMTDQPLSHKEVQEAADAAAPRFKKLVTEIIREACGQA